MVPRLVFASLCAVAIPASAACPAASSSLAAIESLSADAQRLSNEIAKSDARLQDLANQLSSLKVDKERTLEEYREGLFCSGCGKTRSEILATGQQFPHPGQSVVRATQQQLDNKAQEFDQKIAGVEREIAALAQTQADRRRRHADLVGQQLPGHVIAWRDAMNCATTEADQRWERAAALADSTIKQLMGAVVSTTDPAQVRLLKGRLRELDRKRDELHFDRQLKRAELEKAKNDGLARISSALSTAGAPFLVPAFSSMAGMEPLPLALPGADVSLGFDRLSVGMDFGDAKVKLTAEGDWFSGKTSISGTIEAFDVPIGVKRTTQPGGAQVDEAIYPQLPSIPWPGKPLEVETTGKAPQ